MTLSWEPKDPQEVLDYSIDWNNRISSGDALDSSAWAITTDPDSGLTIDSNTFDGAVGTATVWLSGGTLGQEYALTNTVTTSGGRTMEQTVRLKIQAK